MCPKTDKSRKFRLKSWGSILLFPITGFLALIWFLVRVIPKPSRATYPCQRVAAPLAYGFVLWLIGAIASVTAFRKARYYFVRSRHVVAILCIAIGVLAAAVVVNGWREKAARADEYNYTYDDPAPNLPLGIARGINPGRVVWVHNPRATDWAGPGNGHWWENSHTHQAEVDEMMSLAIRGLTNAASDTDAWEALFKHFNGGGVGYQAGE